MVTAEQVASVISPQDIIGHYRGEDGVQFLCSRSLYPNGDTITAFLQPSSTGGLGLSDEGVTTGHLRRAGIETTERRDKAIQLILNAHNMERRGSQFIRSGVTLKNAPHSFREFCDAILRISTFEFEHELTERELYVPKVDAVLRRVAGTRYDVRQKFFDEAHDRDKLYPIDWAIMRDRVRKHVFAITGHDSILTMPAAVHYFRSVGLAVPTLAIVSPQVKLSRRNMARVSHASQELLFRDVHDNEDRIRVWLDAA
jgi:hypothetical protein